ncbi:DUF6477 family protein [Rhodobacteraceae bacterium XHP0102]|nr:DUF6477 family protein [Rhodobacteraceae bacterium XHP0102]
MTDLHKTLQDMRRPPTLVRAARFAAAGQKPLRQSRHDLLAKEEALNSARLSGAAHYSPTQHISILAALIQMAQHPPNTEACRTENRPMLVARGGGVALGSKDRPQMNASGIAALRSAI